MSGVTEMVRPTGRNFSSRSSSDTEQLLREAWPRRAAGGAAGSMGVAEGAPGIVSAIALEPFWTSEY